jgi:hypothetical protein
MKDCNINVGLKIYINAKVIKDKFIDRVQVMKLPVNKIDWTSKTR